MTTVISRVYADHAMARGVVAALAEAGFPASTYEIIGDGAGVVEAIEAARVPTAHANAYAALLGGGATLVVVRAPVTPFGAARTAMEIVDSQASAKVPVASQNVYIREEANRDLYIGLSILRHHPRWFSPDFKPGTGQKRSLLSEVFYWRLLSPRRRSNSALRGGGFLSTRILPLPLLMNRRRRDNVLRGGKRWLYNP